MASGRAERHDRRVITLQPHPLLDIAAFRTELPAPLGELESPPWLRELLGPDVEAPLSRSEDVRAAIRDMLRHGGYKPTGRGKPSSEYLVRVATEGGLDAINPVVDCGNVVSLHSGLPVSVVDDDLLTGPLFIATAAADTRYVFNPSGQEIDVSGLACLHDGEGPCANAVKDAQRTKTSATTRATLSIVWGTLAFPERTQDTVRWYRLLVERLGGRTRDVPLAREGL